MRRVLCSNLGILPGYKTVGSYGGARSSRYEALGKFGEHKRCVRVSLGYASSNSY